MLLFSTKGKLSIYTSFHNFFHCVIHKYSGSVLKPLVWFYVNVRNPTRRDVKEKVDTKEHQLFPHDTTLTHLTSIHTE